MRIKEVNKKMRRFKNKNFDINKWLNEINEFKKEIEKIETDRNIKITVNKNGNSIYFKLNNKDYRISTHHKIEKNFFDDVANFKAENQINLVTNSRKNIIKKLMEILGGK